MTAAAAVVAWPKAERLLSNIDWSFSGPFFGRVASDLLDARRHHWYPATYIPEIPYTLIETLTRSRAVVYDPFGGIGTTAFQAAALARKPVCGENSMIALAAARSVWDVVRDRSSIGAEDFLRKIRRGFDPSARYEEKLSHQLSTLNELARWYNPQTFRQLLYLHCVALPELSGRDSALLSLALSAVARSASGQDRGWGCVADNMVPKAEQVSVPRDAFAKVDKAVRGILRDVDAFQKSLSPDAWEVFARTGESVFRRNDARRRQLLPRASVDAVISSPPYPAMSDYATSQRLSYYWQGLRPDSDLQSEIGARRRRFSSSHLADYKHDMCAVWDKLVPVLKEGGYAAFVMPYFERDKMNNDARRLLVEQVMESLSERGMQVLGSVRRTLPTRRRHHNQNWTSLSQERIWIYRKEA